ELQGRPQRKNHRHCLLCSWSQYQPPRVGLNPNVQRSRGEIPECNLLTNVSKRDDRAIFSSLREHLGKVHTNYHQIISKTRCNLCISTKKARSYCNCKNFQGLTGTFKTDGRIATSYIFDLAWLSCGDTKVE
ncbi:unnamed protein product, partial [Hymenolepis diminuta]